MPFDVIRGNVPTAVVTGVGFGVAGIAVERPAVEELFEALAILGVQLGGGISQDCSFVATFFTSFVVELVDKRREMIVQPLGEHAGTGAERASHVELVDDGFANEGALVGKLVEDVGEFGFNFEGDDGSFGVLFGHGYARDC